MALQCVGPVFAVTRASHINDAKKQHWHLPMGRDNNGTVQ